ncbi:MAG: hypothetical protein FWC15_07355 [Fibromonadales bacterium]|nr:hypothetical protein [Fibromonadales bacterium]
MNNKISLLAASLVLAMAFTFSCSSNDSNSGNNSSIYCVIEETNECNMSKFNATQCSDIGGYLDTECPDEYNKTGGSHTSSSSNNNTSSSSSETFLNWGSDSNGTLEVVNTSNRDIVLFLGERPTDSGIIGGVRAGSTRTVDICKYVADCGVGGWVIVRGITRDVYNDNIHDLTSVTKIDFSAMVTYKSDQKYRITIDYNTIGDYAVRLVNNGRLGMELRKDSPEGEKVAYLPALQQNQLFYTQTTNAMTLFPFYVLYNRTTQSVTTLKATSMFESVQVNPRLASGDILTYYFPNDPSDSWDKIIGTLKSPVAYVTVMSNVMNVSAYFTAGNNWLYSQSGYNDIGPGEQLVFEVEAAEPTEYEKKIEKDGNGNDVEKDDLDKPIAGGLQRNLQAVLYGGAIQVPVLFYNADGTPVDNEPPVIYNGYDYTVSIYGSGQDASGYKATIVKGRKRNISDMLENL